LSGWVCLPLCIEFQTLPGPEARALRAKTMAAFILWVGGARGMNKLTGPWGSINMVFDEFMIQPAFIFVEPCGRGTGHRASGEERSFERS
jgi:hypothetical protein